jgi:diaminohydroxyphosphoribosylaminopyrimidine deaminase/5-amino-6-(5-phosphoribosylamino)uracil reductase
VVNGDRDAFYMSRALALAERGRGRTSPNPMVGAVLVDEEGIVVGRGFHEFAGGPHAEIHALRDAGPRARGATLYCTLEPCSHVGRTGPCAPRVADAGVARVVIATPDPNPLVNGAGIALLRARGIEVASGIRAREARRLNRAFFSVVERGRPYVTMKIALSADGRIAAAPGVRTPMTGPAANRLIHRERAEVDAIAVGSGTVLADDPLLTPRGAFRVRPLVRVVFDSRLRTPPGAKLLSTREAGPVIIVSTSSAADSAPERVAELRESGAEIHSTADPRNLAASLSWLAARGVSSLIVEGGARLHRAFWDAGLVDRVQIFRTPVPLGPAGVEWLPAFPELQAITHTALGADILIEGYVHRVDRGAGSDCGS